jgi:hypothetical protein
MSSDEEQSSLCHSDTFDTNSGMSWDDCSVTGQVGKRNNNADINLDDDACSFESFKNGVSVNTMVSHEDTRTPSIPNKVSAKDPNHDGEEEKNSRKTRFDLLIKHWREKEREWCNKNKAKPSSSNDKAPKSKNHSHV